MYEEVKIVFRANLTVTMVNRALETSSSFATHLQQKLVNIIFYSCCHKILIFDHYISSVLFLAL